jgi:hypothetical protein
MRLAPKAFIIFAVSGVFGALLGFLVFRTILGG